jgi:ABC-type glycerol-3-phosphate transport system substrate-binding protein
MRKGSWGLSVAAALFLALFLGCAAKQGSSAGAITVWHWMTDREPAFQELAKNYEEKSGTKVNFELFAPSDQYSQKVRAACQGQTLPDIFGVLGEVSDFASFIKAGYILDLTPYLEENNSAWGNRFFPQALAVNEFAAGNSYGVKPGVYGVPIDIMTIQMVYNRALLKQLGSQPPQNFAEFLEMGKKIKAAKLQGLVSGWGEPWMVDCLANNFAFNLMGKDKVLATLRGEVSYTDPDWIQVLSFFKQMREAGVLADGVVTMLNKTAEQLFASGKAVFAFNGSWCVNVYKGMNAELDYAGMLPPKVSDKFPISVRGGAGSSFMVNAASKNKAAAVKFLQWLTDAEQQTYLAEATNNLPANKESLGRIPAALNGFFRAMAYSTHPNIWGVSEFPAVVEAWGRGIQAIILGEKTPEEVAAEVQKIKERELAKRR